MQSISACNIGYSPIVALFYSDSNIQSWIRITIIIERLSDGCIIFVVITWIKFKNISPWISTIYTYDQITHKFVLQALNLSH